MDGCQECTSVGNMNFKSCPEVFNIYGRLCVCEWRAGQCWRLGLLSCLTSGRSPYGSY